MAPSRAIAIVTVSDISPDVTVKTGLRVIVVSVVLNVNVLVSVGMVAPMLFVHTMGSNRF